MNTTESIYCFLKVLVLVSHLRSDGGERKDSIVFILSVFVSQLGDECRASKTVYTTFVKSVFDSEFTD